MSDKPIPLVTFEDLGDAWETCQVEMDQALENNDAYAWREAVLKLIKSPTAWYKYDLAVLKEQHRKVRQEYEERCIQVEKMRPKKQEKQERQVFDLNLLLSKLKNT